MSCSASVRCMKRTTCFQTALTWQAVSGGHHRESKRRSIMASMRARLILLTPQQVREGLLGEPLQLHSSLAVARHVRRRVYEGVDEVTVQDDLGLGKRKSKPPEAALCAAGGLPAARRLVAGRRTAGRRRAALGRAPTRASSSWSVSSSGVRSADAASISCKLPRPPSASSSAE